MSKKTSSGVVSKSSSTTTPAVSSAAQTQQKSSISKSAFSPSRLQLALFASVIQGFESQNLRIHDTTTGRLRCQHSARPGTTITSLDWGYFGAIKQEQPQGSTKKRKREQNKAENVVVAFGTTSSEICMFSPSAGRIIGKLGRGHDRGIRDFRFTVENYQEGWSIGGDGKLLQWDLTTGQAMRTVSLPDPSISSLSMPTVEKPQVICASSTPYMIELGSISDEPRIGSYDSFKNPIHYLYRSGTYHTQNSETFLAGDSGRYINIYDIAQKRLLHTLVAGSEIEAADFHTPGADSEDLLSEQMLAVVTRAGSVELFFRPFVQSKPVNGDFKSKSKSLTRKASALVKLVDRNSKSTPVPVFSASLQGPELMVATTQGGVEVSFQKIRWQDEYNMELLFTGTKEVAYSKASSTLNTVATNGVKDAGKSTVDESRTVVIDGGADGSSQAVAIAIMSSEDEAEQIEEAEEDSEEGSDDSDGSDGESEVLDNASRFGKPIGADTAATDAAIMEDDPKSTAAEVDEEMHEEMHEDEEDEPTFGDLVAARTQGMISIADSLQPRSSTLVSMEGGKTLAMHSGISLATVLTQSLRTNDNSLLESCFHATDSDIIKSTIQRLDSSLAGILLSKLAERLSSRPGRYGHLLTWAQWTCVVHGGAIAGRPDVTSKLRTLYKVLTQRANSLEPLLLLKGKLDMLDAQLTLRKEIQAQRQQRNHQDEAGVIYIEGNDNWTSDEDEAVGVRPAVRKGKQHRKALEELLSDGDSDSDEDMPLLNGVGHSDSEEEEEGSDEESEVKGPKRDGLVDDEAEESDEDSQASEEEEADALDEDESSDEEEDDSEMDSFINDDEISIEEEGDEIDIDGDDTPEKPPVKRTKRS